MATISQARRPAPHPVLHVDQKHTIDKENVGYWSDIFKQKDKEKHDLQRCLWAVSGVAVVLVVAVVILAFGRKEFHYRDITDALGNTYQFGIRSVDAHDQWAVKLVLERYIKGVRLVTKDAQYQYDETNYAWRRSKIKAQNAISDNFAREGKPEDLSARDISRSVVEGTVQVAFQTGNTWTTRWMEQTRDPVQGNKTAQYAGSGVLELKDPAKLTGTERQAAPDGVWINEFSFNKME
jgi:type IV secretory pathway TrbF-like protein